MRGGLQSRTVHVRVQGVDNYDQPVEGESFVTRELRSSVLNWGESFRVGGGPMGVGVVMGVHVTVEQTNGNVVAEGVVGLDRVFEEMSDGRGSCVVRMKTANGAICVGERAWREA